MSQVLIVFLVFLGCSALVGPYDWYVYRQVKAKNDLEAHGVRGVATIVRVGSMTSAIAVSSTTITYRFEPTPGQTVSTYEVLTSGLYPPHEGDLIDIVYLPEAPEHSKILGNAGIKWTLLVPLIPLNILWLVLFVGIFVVAFDPNS